jgi:hypothetical protein
MSLKKRSMARNNINENKLNYQFHKYTQNILISLFIGMINFVFFYISINYSIDVDSSKLVSKLSV